MERTLAVGATSGSVSALLIKLLSGFLADPSPFDCPACPLCLDQWQFENLDWPSVGVGLLVGLLLGPVVDLIQLLRQRWKVWLQTRLRALDRSDSSQGSLYKIL